MKLANILKMEFLLKTKGLIACNSNTVQISSFFDDLTYARIEVNRCRGRESKCLALKNQQSQLSSGEVPAGVMSQLNSLSVLDRPWGHGLFIK